MASKWYGSLNNRLEEGRQFTDEIKVGTGVTEYGWSDRYPYEVIAVQDQKHITIRSMNAKHVGEAFENTWEITSNEKATPINLVKRGEYWYQVKEATIADIESPDVERRLWVAMNGFDASKIRAKGKQIKYSKMNISIGKADKYYDYSF